ncbi:MAG TPA: hypothetical protein VFG42_27280 [Baekduia sp.]|uniref:hypothetical protein n=1 Tax=Baekduia sp. TaxID=2600305 RepID=UPI002D79C150|nr:hypothetical protein [Baekduia sp.]HET6510529.1 hypothetical protein [Baekduia sp.]
MFIPVAAGAATLPARTTVGPAQGVTATASGTTLTLGFTGAAAAWGKAHAGKRLEVACSATPERGLLLAKTPPGEESADGITGKGRVAADGASARIALHGAAGDACRIDGAPGWTLPPSGEMAYAALTPTGLAWVDDLAHGLRMTDVIYAARPHEAYAPAADVVALGGGEVVALDDPNGTPPAGKIGYWSKGRAVSLITTSDAGRRLVIQDLGGGMLRTNVTSGLVGWSPVAGLKDEPPEEGSAFGGDGSSSGEEPAEEGVHVRRIGGRVVFRFTGKAAKVYRRHAGGRVRVGCMRTPPRPLLGEPATIDAHPAHEVVRVPRHGGVIRGDAPAGHRDVCWVETLDGGDLASAALTREGVRWMMDSAAILAFVFAGDGNPFELAEPGATRYPGAATLAATHAGLVPLASPGARLKVGTVGVWTDAEQKALVALGGLAGLRYVYADEGDGMLRTNLLSGLLGTMAKIFVGATGTE